MNSLYEAYVQGHPGVRARFSRAPETLHECPLPRHAWADGAAAAVNRYQDIVGVPKSTVSGNEPVIITGQQPGLLGGPLYTVLKAITALQAASACAGSGSPCLPLFWVAGDDHDFEEVSTACVLTKQYDLLPLKYQPEDRALARGDIPMHLMPLSPHLHGLVDAAANACMNSELRDEVAGFLHDSLDSASSLSHWFSLIMAKLFSKTDLRLFAPHLDEARCAAVPVLRKEIEFPLESTRLLREAGDLLESLGFDAPVKRDGRACNFFLERDRRRRKVDFVDGNYIVAGDSQTYSVGDMLALLDAEPASFSPNVALRPVVQQHLFVPAAYVAGPGEIAYWAQLGPVFSFFELPMPIVYPRIRAHIIPPKVRQIMDRYRLTVDDLREDKNLLLHALQLDGDAPHVGAFMDGRPRIEEELEGLLSSVLDSSDLLAVRRAAASCRRHVLFGLDRFERALRYADLERRTVAETRLARARNTLYPLGKPQERVLSVFTFLFSHGWEMIDRMVRELDHSKTDLQEMVL